MTLPGAFAANLLRSSCRAYASATVRCLGEERPDLMDHGLPPTFASPVDDTEVRILHLAESVGVDRPALLQHDSAWYKVAFHHRGVPADYLPASLGALRRTLVQELPAAAAALVARHLDLAIAHLPNVPVETRSHIDPRARHGRIAGNFLLAILEGRGDDAVGAVRTALADGVPIEDLHDHVLLPAQRETGRMWLTGEIPIADEHYGSQVVDRVLWLLQDRIAPAPANAPCVLTMGVGGNLHDLGLRIVAQRLQLAGLRVQNLGSNMPASDLEWALVDRRVDLVALSATLTLHLDSLARTVAQLRTIEAQQGSKHRPVLAGGGPFAVVPDLHEVVGADAAAIDGAGAALAARRLLGR